MVYWYSSIYATAISKEGKLGMAGPQRVETAQLPTPTPPPNWKARNLYYSKC
jgi:hypothetical protein